MRPDLNGKAAALAILGCVAAGISYASSSAATAGLSNMSAQEPSIWSGVFTAEQAKRGAAIYNRKCVSCHGLELEGGEMAPALTGPAFGANWGGLSLGDIYERIRLTMPYDDPGGLSRQENIDVVAYMLSIGKFPAGQNELPTRPEFLNVIVYEPKRPGGGPR